ncbi:siderophore-interacting protein [Thalassiella azotivora]
MSIAPQALAADTGPYVQARVTVRSVRRVSPSFVRVTFAGEDVGGLCCPGPDQRIKVAFPLEGRDDVALPPGGDWYRSYRLMREDERPPIRTYTIRHLRADAGELDVDMVLHGDSGPASAWAGRAAVGDRVVLVAPSAAWRGPTGGYEWQLPAGTARVLVAGDETALPAVCAILERLPGDVEADVVLDVPHGADLDLVPRRPGVRVHGTARSEVAPGLGTGPGAGLVDVVRDLALPGTAPAPAPFAGSGGAAATGDVAELEAQQADEETVLWDAAHPATGAPLYAWVAGEASAVRALRRHLVAERGVDRSLVSFMGYWRLGRAEC